MHVLVVEDDRKISDFIVQGLRQEGYAVDATDNGIDAFQLAMAGAYDAAVVDVRVVGPGAHRRHQ